MRIIIDLNQHEAVRDFGVSTPPNPYEFKSQDTIDFQIYFVLDGIVQDMGAGFVLKFGMIKTGDTTNTILAYQTTSAYLTDPNGNVYYQMQVVMNTSQMATAIGTSPSINCTIELRYQDSIGEIIHSLNISAIVFSTILVETGVTPPGVSTGYPDASTIELLVHKGQPSGYAGLDSSGHILSSQLAGMAELVAHKDQPSGYAGLSSSSKIPVAEIPIDGTTVVVSSGVLSAPLAGGDMKKSTYDTNNDSVVDHAHLADTATAATSAATATTLVASGSLGTLSTVWGRDAAGNQGLFTAPAVTMSTGGGALTPDQGIEWYEHFDSATISQNWSSSATGTAALVRYPGTYGLTSTNKVLGSVDLEAGTSSGAKAKIWYGATTPQSYFPALGVCTFEARVAFQNIASSTSAYPYMTMGIADGWQSGGPVQGYYFEYYYVTAGANWNCRGHDSGGAGSIHDTLTTGPDAGVFHKYKIVTTANWDGAKFYIDGTMVDDMDLSGFGFSGFANNQLVPSFYIDLEAGTTNWKITIDWVHFTYVNAT